MLVLKTGLKNIAAIKNGNEEHGKYVAELWQGKKIITQCYLMTKSPGIANVMLPAE